MIYDICIIGSGAGAGPIAYELSKAGKSVIILEKSPWIKTSQFTKDEITATRRSVYTPNLKDEPQVLEQFSKGKWVAQSTYKTGNDFWNGNVVGGSSNFMSGFFARLKPKDFRLLSEYGEIKGANIVDWPISYDDLEPYYEKTERIVGISGKVVPHSQLEPRSTADFPFPPLAEHPVSAWLDKAATELNYEILPLPRAILSRPYNNRKACVYSNYCGSYGCATDAKGSSRAALLNTALETGNCTILPNAKVYHLETNGNFLIKKAWYYDLNGQKKSINAKYFVVAAQAIETSRLLLMSKNKEFPNGLANNNRQVGKNLIFSGGGTGKGYFYFKDFSEKEVEQLKVRGLFTNRTIQQWYEFTDPESGKRTKGGIVDFLWEHANPISKAIRQKRDANGNLIYGELLKEKLHYYFTQMRKLTFEVFVDWLPTDNTFVSLSNEVKDKWGDPVAKIRIQNHEQDIKAGRFIAQKAEELLKKAGAKDVSSSISGGAPANLQAGGCRFGNDPKTSVLDKYCKAHEVENLFITDGSFMPTGGSVPLTWTIYANSFRVADYLKNFVK